MIAAERGVGGDDDPHRAIHTGEFLDRSDVFHIAHAGAAVLGGKNRAQEAELAEFLDRVQREIAGLIPLHDIGGDLAFGKLAHRFFELLLLFVQQEIQDSSG